MESCIVLGCCSWRNSTFSVPGVVPSDVPVGRLVVASIVPDNPLHFHRLDNCSSTAVPDAVLPPPSMESCIALPSDVPVGRLVVKVLTLYF